MFEKDAEKLAEEWLSKTDNHLDERKEHFLSEYEYAKQAFLAGYEAGIGRLRYCCTCKHYSSCLNEEDTTMYGICGDWEIKE